MWRSLRSGAQSGWVVRVLLCSYCAKVVLCPACMCVLCVLAHPVLLGRLPSVHPRYILYCLPRNNLPFLSLSLSLSLLFSSLPFSPPTPPPPSTPTLSSLKSTPSPSSCIVRPLEPISSASLSAAQPAHMLPLYVNGAFLPLLTLSISSRETCSCNRRNGGCRWFKCGQPGPQEHAYKVGFS